MRSESKWRKGDEQELAREGKRRGWREKRGLHQVSKESLRGREVGRLISNEARRTLERA